jgi:hypothetical protein
VNAVSGAIHTATTDGQALIKFFEDTGPKATAVKAIIVVLAGAMLGYAASAIPAAVVAIGTSVVAFGAQTVAAGAAAVAVLAATWPFILVGAVIAAVAVGIYELVQHWGDIQKFFGNIGAAIGGFFSRLGSVVQERIALVKLYFAAGLLEIQARVQQAMQAVQAAFWVPINAVVGFFKWLYDHNTYFQELVDAIKAAFTTAEQFIMNLWSRVTGWLGAQWNRIKETVQLYFAAATAIISVELNRAWNYIVGMWTGIVSYLEGIGKAILAPVQRAWEAVTGYLSGLTNTASGAVKTGVIDPITSSLTGLIKTAEDWGKNLIAMLVKGITDNAGKVGDAAKNVAGNVAKFLGFHSPAEEGPGADADTWMPNLGQMLANGLSDQRNAVGQAAAVIAAQIAAPITGLAGASGSAFPLSVVGAGGNGPLALPSAASTSYPNPAGVGTGAGAGAAGGASQGQPIILQVDGRTLAKVLLPYIPGLVSSATGVRGF